MRHSFKQGVCVLLVCFDFVLNICTTHYQWYAPQHGGLCTIDSMVSCHVWADTVTLHLKESEVMKGHPVCFVCVNCQHQRGIATDRSTSLHSTCSVTFWMVTEKIREELNQSPGSSCQYNIQLPRNASMCDSWFYNSSEWSTKWDRGT